MRSATVLALLAMSACTGSGGPSADLVGGIQKGPFVIGSTVVVSVLDANGAPTGDVFNTTTINDKGEFAVTANGGPLADIATSGFHFDEQGGALSGAPITLRAVATLNGSSPATFINALTHLAEPKAVADIAAGADPESAIADAEAAARATLGLFQPADLGSAGGMSVIGGDDDANAYLLALSCTLSAGSDVNLDAMPDDAVIQETLNTVAAEVAAGEPLSDALAERFARGKRFLNPDYCMANLRDRLAAIGDATSTVPDIRRALDFDGDGIADALDDDADGDGVPAAHDRMVAAAYNNPLGISFFDAGGTLWNIGGIEQGAVSVNQYGTHTVDMAGMPRFVDYVSGEDLAWDQGWRGWFLAEDGSVYQETLNEDLILLEGAPTIVSLQPYNIGLSATGEVVVLTPGGAHILPGTAAVAAVGLPNDTTGDGVGWIDAEGAAWIGTTAVEMPSGRTFVAVTADPQQGYLLDDVGDAWTLAATPEPVGGHGIVKFLRGFDACPGSCGWTGTSLVSVETGEVVLTPTVAFDEPLAVGTAYPTRRQGFRGLLVSMTDGGAGFIANDAPDVIYPFNLPR